MKIALNQLIREDMKDIGLKCPNCHAKMRIKKGFIDSWECPNKKCRFVGMEL